MTFILGVITGVAILALVSWASRPDIPELTDEESCAERGYHCARKAARDNHD